MTAKWLNEHCAPKVKAWGEWVWGGVGQWSIRRRDSQGGVVVESEGFGVYRVTLRDVRGLAYRALCSRGHLVEAIKHCAHVNKVGWRF